MIIRTKAYLFHHSHLVHQLYSSILELEGLLLELDVDKNAFFAQFKHLTESWVISFFPKLSGGEVIWFRCLWFSVDFSVQYYKFVVLAKPDV